MKQKSRWYVGTVGDGRGGRRRYAINCRTRRHARLRIAEQSTTYGYRASWRDVGLVEGLPSPSIETIAATSLRYRED